MGTQPSVRSLHLGCRVKIDATSGREIESTSHFESSERPRFKITKGKALAGIGALVIVAIIVGNVAGVPHFHFMTQSTSTTQPTATPSTPLSHPTSITPPRAFTRREVCIPGRHGLSVGTSSESYPKSYLDGVADGVVGHSELETRSILDDFYRFQKM